MTSSRLPGKALMKVKGKPVLAYILERVEKVVDRENIIIATSLELSDDPIVQFAKKKDINCYRGSLTNVADRFYKAAEFYELDYAVRINGDNILMDVNVLSQMLDILSRRQYTFLSNVKARTYPVGMSVEIIRVAYLKKFLKEISKTQRYLEHVLLYFYDNEPTDSYFLKNNEVPEAAGLRLALDTKEDLEFIKRIIDCFDRPHWEYNLNEIVEFLNRIK